MSSFRIVSFGSIAAALLATGGYAAEQGYAAPTSEQGYAGAPVAKGHVHAGFRRYGMSPELKMLWRKEMSTELKSVAKGQRMSRLRSEWAAMTDQQKTAKVAELTEKIEQIKAESGVSSMSEAATGLNKRADEMRSLISASETDLEEQLAQVAELKRLGLVSEATGAGKGPTTSQTRSPFLQATPPGTARRTLLWRAATPAAQMSASVALRPLFCSFSQPISGSK